MAGLNATVESLLQKGTGNSAVDSKRIRAASSFNAVDIANAVDSLQRQLDVVTGVLRTTPAVQKLAVTDQSGALIGWVGSRVSNGVSYLGAWFRQIWIGGSNPATAVISTDTSGNVTINGATITLNSNGVTTTLNNNVTAFGTQSIQSLDNATQFYSGLDPFSLHFIDSSGNQIARLSSGGDAGNLTLRDSGTKQILLVTGGAGSPKLDISNGTHTMVLSSGSGLVFDSNTVVDTSRNITGVTINATTNYQANGTPGVGGTLALGTSLTLGSITVATGGFVSLNTDSSAVFGTPGAGQSNGTVVTGVSLFLTTDSAIKTATLNTTNYTWTEGIRTA